VIGSWLRRVVLWCCRRLGGSSGLYQRTLLLHLVALAGITAAVALAASLRLPASRHTFTHISTWFGPLRPWLTVWNVLSIWAFGFVALAIADGRRRLVITPFTDGSGGDLGLNVQGFSTLVAAELSLLRDLFTEFESGRALQATPGTLTPLKATFQTGASDALVEKAVTTDSSFSLGPFKVPVGIVLSLVGRIVQGPRVAGELYRDGAARVVTIRVGRAGGERVLFLVDAPEQVDGENIVWRRARDLARDLACQLFTTLALDDGVNWRALASFAAGVRAYRESLRMPESRKLQLKTAERCLIDAIAQDPRFDLASYTELDQLEAAGVAFTRAVNSGTPRWSVFYALALVSHFRAQQDFERALVEAGKVRLATALEYCEQALALADDSGAQAQVLNLRSAVLWWRAWRVWGDEAQQARWRDLFAAGRTARRAMWRSWLALCRAELGLTDARRVAFERERARTSASRYLQDLAAMAVQGARLITLGLGPQLAALAPERQERVEYVTRGHNALQQAQTIRGWTGVRTRMGLRLAVLLARLALAATNANISLTSRSANRWIALRVASYTLREARALTPDVAAIDLNLGIACLERGRCRQAIAPLERAARLAPGTADAWAYLARALMGRAQVVRANEAVRRVFENFHAASDAALASVAQAMADHQQLLERARALGSRPSFWGSMRLAYELVERDVSQLKLGQAILEKLTTDAAFFDETSAIIRRTSERATTHRAFIGEVSAEEGKGDAGLERLKAMAEERRQQQHDWEVGHVGEALARVHRRADRTADAEACLRDTITFLERTLPTEVQRRGLYAELSRMLRLQNKLSDALEQAKIAVLKDPVSAYERIELGSVYSALAEDSAGQAAFETAARLTPDDPRPHLKLVTTHMRQIEDETTKAGRIQRLQAASEQITLLLDLLPRTDDSRNMLHFQLARLHASAGRHTDAIRELRTLQRRDYSHLAVALDLADAYLLCQRWVEAEQQFRRAATEVNGLIGQAAGRENEPVESPVGDTMVLGSAAVFARLGIAATLAERDVFLDEAAIEVARARTTLTSVADAELRQRWLSSCDYWDGVILLKQEQVDAAIKKLEAALLARGDAESSFSLADALTRKAELSPPGDRVPLLRRAVRYYEEARRLDLTEDLAGKLSTALARAQAMLPPPGQSVAAN